MSCKVRFAPSPTGKMHIGNARIAIVNFLFCKKNNGHFVLRIDDTDTERSSKESEIEILNDLKWLGILHDSFFRQSERLQRYIEIKDLLIKNGYLYECYETKEELEYKRKMQITKGKPPVYDRASLFLSDKQKYDFERQGIKPYYRFKLPEEVVEWDDLVLGHISYNLANVSDPVIIKADGTFLYTFASVIDDYDIKITHVIRGQDHTTNTAVQIAMWKAIDDSFKINFGHLSLLVSSDGSQFSKRIGSLGLDELRKQGIESMAIMDLMATLGTSCSTIPFTNVNQLIDYFDLSRFSTNSPKFNLKELEKLNKKIIRSYSYNDVISAGINVSQDLFDLIHENIATLDEYNIWKVIFSDDFICDYEFNDEEKNALKQAKTNIDEVKNKTGKENKYVLEPLRIALTGLAFGPNLGKIIDLLGKERVFDRLDNAIGRKNAI